MTQLDATPNTLPVSARRAAWSAWALWALTLLLVISCLALLLYWCAPDMLRGDARPRAGAEPSLNMLPKYIADLFGLATFLAFATLGALMVSRAKERRIGWLYCAIGLVGVVDNFSGLWAIVALLVTPNTLPA